jgi:hypothetical protein
MNRRLRMLTAALSFVYAIAAHAESPKFHAAPGLEPVIGRYLITLDVTVAPELAATSAEALARAYNGQLEPFAGSDVRQFAVSMLPARARALSGDPRVHEITEIVQSDSALRPPPSNSSASLNGRLTPAPRDISSSGTYAYDGSGTSNSSAPTRLSMMSTDDSR